MPTFALGLADVALGVGVAVFGCCAFVAGYARGLTFCCSGLVAVAVGVGGLSVDVGLGAGNLGGGGVCATEPLRLRLGFNLRCCSAAARYRACSSACVCIALHTLSLTSRHSAICSSASAISFIRIRHHQMLVTYLFDAEERTCNYFANPARNLFAALSIAVSSSPANTALFTVSSVDSKSLSLATSIAYLPFASSSIFVP